MRPLVALCGVLFATAATAQTVPTSQPDVVVQGQRSVKPKDVTRQARAITEVADAFDEPLPRFEQPVCPLVYGVPADFAQAMTERVRADAAAAGIATAKAPCKPNILVLFVKNGQAEIKALQNKPGRLFEGLTANEIGRLAHDPGPVHAWVRAEERGRDGDALTAGPSDDVRGLFTILPSRIGVAVRLDIHAAILILDVPAADGMTATQIADYAAMRTLARTKPRSASPSIDTILSLFDLPLAQRPVEMTTFDLGYLRALYRPTAGNTATATLSGVTDAVRKASAEASRPDRQR